MEKRNSGHRALPLWWTIAHRYRLPDNRPNLFSLLSSTWGRADRQASHDSTESGAFCFVFLISVMAVSIANVTSLAKACCKTQGSSP